MKSSRKEKIKETLGGVALVLGVVAYSLVARGMHLDEKMNSMSDEELAKLLDDPSTCDFSNIKF